MTQMIRQLLADTTSTSNTATQGTEWLRKIIDGAQKEMFFLQFAQAWNVPQGNKDIVVPYRTNYIGTGNWEATASEGASVNYTTFNQINGVTLTPAEDNKGIALSYKSMRVNKVNIMQKAREELMYYYRDIVDQSVQAAYAAATASTSTTKGRQTIAGGDATGDTTTDVEAGDILTTDMISKCKTLLQSTTTKYWDSGTESNSSAAKYPWRASPSQPFVLVIAPEQEMALLNDPQFVNAAEFGSDKVVLNGQIKKYLGFNVVVSNNLDAKTSASSGYNTNGHECYAIKSKVSSAIAWGQKPKMHLVDFPSQLEKRMILEMAYQADTVHDDAIVHIKVADE